ncbi:hypothetical protein ACIBCN_16705 [Nocardia sp. NPDC051052]|uniref:hypothetical protein n=1 Tax=Nocardia sp. NPDC051052 TaxID=3364322 RepID=UPI0037895021
MQRSITGRLAVSGPAIVHYACREFPGGTNIPKWQPGDHQRFGRFVCAASDENGLSVYCSRDNGGGNSFNMARTWYRLLDGARAVRVPFCRKATARLTAVSSA